MIAIISGTNREGSLSSVFSHAIENIYQKMGVECKVLELSLLLVETFSPLAYSSKPDKVLEFTEVILNATGLVIVVPEYNGSMPGALKLFIDLLPYPDSFENPENSENLENTENSENPEIGSVGVGGGVGGGTGVANGGWC